jgi:hypothetical protein
MARPARLAVLVILLLPVLAWALVVEGLDSKAAGDNIQGIDRARTEQITGAYGVATSTPTPPPTPRLPSITYFTCDPCVVEPGGATTLRWDLAGATAAYLDGQGVIAPGSKVVYPDQTTTYQLVAIGEEGQSEKTVTVEVRGLPIIHYFTCLPCEISRGEQSTLSWDLSGATAAYLDGYGVPAPGNTLVAPVQTTTYRLVAVGERGSVERLVTVSVREGGDPETVSQALRQIGYDVTWVGYLPLAGGGDSIAVIMSAVSGDLYSQETASQLFGGFKALFENYPDQVLTVGLYDGERYLFFASVESASFEAFLRGEMDGQVFWDESSWNVWDDWALRWLEGGEYEHVHKDFVSKQFGF